MTIVRYIVSTTSAADPRSRNYLKDAHALGFTWLKQIRCSDLYFLEGDFAPGDLAGLAERLLSDPVMEQARFEILEEPAPRQEIDRGLIEIALRPGVTDPVAEEIVRAGHQLGYMGVQRAATGLRFEVDAGDASQADLDLLVKRLLVNPVIQSAAFGLIEPNFPAKAEASSRVEAIRILGLSDEDLMETAQARRTALDLREMQAIQRYCESEGRDLTDVELETIAQTWSEHCVHKTFKARVEIENFGALPAEIRAGYAKPTIDGLMKTFLRSATQSIGAKWVRSAFVDNAGIIDYDGVNEISFKVETHNHPSAIEPFGGANTGIGGVIRDVLGVSAKPVAATDVLCFGPQELDFEDLPEGVLHPRRIQSGVVAGIQDYGNKIGLPTVSGGVYYDRGFTSNPLVFAGCVGIAPLDSHPKGPQNGDRVIVIGGRTGRDGLRGATFSSMTMDAQTGEVAGASVQIGAPITEKGCIEVIVRARDEKLYNAITDCGAGGLSSAVGEMASKLGADVELRDVRLKYPGLAPWEIWLSEAQERMVMAVPPENLARLREICALFDVEITDIGEFHPSGRLIVRYGSHPVLNLDNAFLHEGIPQRQMRAVIPAAAAPKRTKEKPALPQGVSANDALLRLLAHPNISSKAPIIRLYDHEILGGTLIKPLTGVQMDAPADAAVMVPPGTEGAKALVLGAGMNPEYGKLNAYRMACAVIDEAIRNVVAAGADPERIAILDNFCWGDPLRPEVMGSLIEACRGCHDTAVQFGAPFISGKDSLNNEYLGMDGLRHAIPPTLLISSLGMLDDRSLAVSMDLKDAGSLIYQIGVFDPRLGASHYRLEVDAQPFDEEVPPLSAQAADVYRALNRAISARIVRACHDLSEGGLAVCAAEMCIGGRLGMNLELPGSDPLNNLFGETTGCLLVEVPQVFRDAFEEIFEELPMRVVGTVQARPGLQIRAGALEIDVPVEELVRAWNTSV